MRYSLKQTQRLLSRMQVESAWMKHRALDIKWRKMQEGRDALLELLLNEDGVTRYVDLSKESKDRMKKEYDDNPAYMTSYDAAHSDKTPWGKITHRAAEIMSQTPELGTGLGTSTHSWLGVIQRRTRPENRTGKQVRALWDALIADLDIYARAARIRKKMDKIPEVEAHELKVGHIIFDRGQGIFRVDKITHGGKRIMLMPLSQGVGHDVEVKPIKMNFQRWSSGVGSGRSELYTVKVRVISSAFLASMRKFNPVYENAIKEVEPVFPKGHKS